MGAIDTGAGAGVHGQGGHGAVLGGTGAGAGVHGQGGHGAGATYPCENESSPPASCLGGAQSTSVTTAGGGRYGRVYSNVFHNIRASRAKR